MSGCWLYLGNSIYGKRSRARRKSRCNEIMAITNYCYKWPWSRWFITTSTSTNISTPPSTINNSILATRNPQLPTPTRIFPTKSTTHTDLTPSANLTPFPAKSSNLPSLPKTPSRNPHHDLDSLQQLSCSAYSLNSECKLAPQSTLRRQWTYYLTSNLSRSTRSQILWYFSICISGFRTYSVEMYLPTYSRRSESRDRSRKGYVVYHGWL